MTHEVPDYDDLGADGSVPLGSSWGLFGDDDQRGTLNFLDPKSVVEAAELVREGLSISLNWRNDLPDPPILGRGMTDHHRVGSAAGFTDDWFDGFYPQRSSQWDALMHARHPVHGYYNGFSDDVVVGDGGVALGIQNAAVNGIVGRFVLADIAGARASAGRPLDPAESTPVGPEEIARVLADSGVTTRTGDILLVHFGWTAWYEAQSTAARAALGGGVQFGTPGLAATRQMAAWLWNSRFAAVAADVPSLEVMPLDFSDPDRILHYQLIPLLGFCVGELLDLDALASTCRRLGRYEGMLISAPMNQPGGAGSPANAVALL